jgi:hypothetical protein
MQNSYYSDFMYLIYNFSQNKFSFLKYNIEIQSPTEAVDFSSNLCIQTDSGAHSTSCTMGNAPPQCKAWPGVWCWPLTPF